MADNFTPDVTGLDPSYYVDTYQRVIHKSNQKIIFDSPVFHNEILEVIMLGGTPVNLDEGVDWLVQPDDIHDDAIAVVKGIDSLFDGVLLESITIVRPFTDDYSVQLKYNQLYVDTVNYARINKTRQLEVTPALISNMVEQISYLQQMILNSSDQFTEQSNIIKVLEEDPKMENPDNLIENEPHDVNTLDGINHIRPIYGAFFNDSLIVKNGHSGDTLVLDEDYEIVEVDMAKTRGTSNHSGVFLTIHILVEFVGEVLITYHAYGGSADVKSIRNIHERMKIVEEFLSSNSYVTPKTLPADPAMMAVNNKLQEMEGLMRLLLQNGLPSYGDVSTGTAVLKKLVSADATLHWWSLATLYRVDGSSDNVTSDVFKFRVKALQTGLMMECSVAVNVNLGADQKLEVTCDNANIPKDALEKITPKLRILEVTTAGNYSGVVLQIGLKLGTGILQESIVVEDMSGMQSCWKVVPFTADSINPEDTTVMMPNELMVFTYGESTSIATEATIPFTTGLNLLKTDSNVPLDLCVFGNPTVVDNVESDAIVQEVGMIDITKVTSFKNTLTINIGEPTEVSITVSVPITKWDDANKVWEGSVNVVINNVPMVLACKLYYDIATFNYVMSYVVTPTEVSITDTINVTTTKLIF